MGKLVKTVLTNNGVADAVTKGKKYCLSIGLNNFPLKKKRRAKNKKLQERNLKRPRK